MMNIFNWVPWFEQLVKNIDEGGKEYLIERAIKVNWGVDLDKNQLLQHGKSNIDPFSFFRFLAWASKEHKPQSQSIYDSVHNEFELPGEVITPPNYFPRSSRTKYLVFNGRKNFDLNLIWKLFRQVTRENSQIVDDDVKAVLKIDGVGLSMLTQTLSLIAPNNYFPCELFRKLKVPGATNSWEEYKKQLANYKNIFLGLKPYEINFVVWTRNPLFNKNVHLINIDYFDDGQKDWETFKKNWYIKVDEELHDSFVENDIIIVRKGQINFEAIGVVFNHMYSLHEKNNECKEVLWINLKSIEIENIQKIGMHQEIDRHSETYSLLRNDENYKGTFDLIEKFPVMSEKDQNNSGTNSIPIKNKTIHPLNQILFGPPGTGKTWHAVNHAIAIIEDHKVKLKDRDRQETRENFEKLKQDGQIEMVTFHQSFTYEDFVEGIKPNLKETELLFKIDDGIFKRICERAVDASLLVDTFAEYAKKRVKQGNEVRLFDEEDHRFIERVEPKTIVLGGVKRAELSRKKIKELYLEYYFGRIKKKEDIPNTRGSKKNHLGLAIYYYPFLKLLDKFHKENFKKRKYVLIIDEINRGNIAKIFGELITLVEESKRSGVEDETSVTLPYSKKIFKVPDNVYLIGTMNTADRSIAILDTALRRRFDFIEMMPNPKHDSISKDVDGIKLRKLFKKMNSRIVVLLDREHQIGHTYFMDINSIEDLKKVFQSKIIPLLQEYFYDDWEKIELVLNKNGFIKEEIDLHKSLFVGNVEGMFDSEKKIYYLSPANSSDWNDKAKYIQIYKHNNDETQNKLD